MRISAYILAADPAWIEASVMSYYDIVDRIIVSYDENGNGWTGVPVAVDECLARLKAIDSQGKCVYAPGNYSRLNHEPMENETYQRQCALEIASTDSDWVFQLDADEILGDSGVFLNELGALSPAFSAVDWPMRTFFQQTAAGKFLEVCGFFGTPVASYPGPVAVRAGTILKYARQTAAKTWRIDFRKTDTDPAAGNREVHKVIDEKAGIFHMSWVRSEEEIRRKLSAWGHSSQFDGATYVERVWKAAPRKWRWMFRFHPLCPKWWPALRAVDLGELSSGKAPVSEPAGASS